MRKYEEVEFLRHVVALGFNPTEFILSAHESVEPRGRPPGRVISVARKDQGRDFNTEKGTGWIHQAIRALREGHFGRP